MFILEFRLWSSMRDDSADKNTYCLCRGPEFSSEHPHGGLEPFVTPVPRDHMALLTSEGTRDVHGALTYIQAKQLDT